MLWEEMRDGVGVTAEQNQGIKLAFPGNLLPQRAVE